MIKGGYIDDTKFFAIDILIIENESIEDGFYEVTANLEEVININNCH